MRTRFIEQLNDLHKSAGQPSYARMNQLSVELGVPRELTKSTISDILAGKRLRPPEWEWVSSFVKVCETQAVRAELSPVLVPLHEWERRWREAQAAQGDAEPSSAAQERRRRYVGEYGRTGARLLRGADEGNTEACFQLAVILLADDHAEEAEQWLSQATRAGHRGASLLHGNPLARSEAIELAFRYGSAYEAEGPAKRPIAAFFYGLAARCGHLEATAKLRGETPSALLDLGTVAPAAPSLGGVPALVAFG
ncbi:hypothetical protein [Nonomuraea dietziae]|uniref:hypothetical protein n=1 Tax=Nonomuraea dietziae TaxID=65515 RepID=UPI003431ED4F